MPQNLWRKPETWAVLGGLGLETGGFVAGMMTSSIVLAGIALGGAALLGAAFALSKRG
jgi:hypothetical protein